MMILHTCINAQASEEASLSVNSGDELRVLFLAGENGHEARERLKEVVGRGVNYFYAELHEGTLLVHPLSQGEKLPMQFGREVRLTMTQFSNHVPFSVTFSRPKDLLCVTMPGSGSALVVVMSANVCRPLNTSAVTYDTPSLVLYCRIKRKGIDDGHPSLYTFHCLTFVVHFFQVLANILGTPERGDWKQCKLDVSEETAMADQFKEQFQEFDPVP